MIDGDSYALLGLVWVVAVCFPKYEREFMPMEAFGGVMSRGKSQFISGRLGVDRSGNERGLTMHGIIVLLHHEAAGRGDAGVYESISRLNHTV